MDLDNLKNIIAEVNDGEYHVTVKYDSIEREFTDSDRNYILYSRVEYSTEDFNWEAVLPTVKIPYRDPSFGFMLNGVVFSSVGLYQRAPGTVLCVGRNAVTGEAEPRIDIITDRNTTISICYRRFGVQIEFSVGESDRYVPIGIFLKAISGLPYAEILKRFAYKPPMLVNSFPCEVPKRAVDLAKVATYGVDGKDEPSVDDCVDMVYNAITRTFPKSQISNYLTHWKYNRVKSYTSNLNFKSESNYESNLSLHSRAIGTTVDKDVSLRIFDADGSITEFKLSAGTYIDEEVAEQLRWYDITQMRVRTSRSFILQEDTPMLFRAVGYRLASGLQELDVSEGTYIDKELLKKINQTKIRLLEVVTPEGRKVLVRSSTDPEIGDFVTGLNALFTAEFMNRDDSSQYEVANRIVVDYNKQVNIEVEQIYQSIIDALIGCQQLKNVLESLPRLPSTALESHLRDGNTRELSQAEITNVMARAVAEKRSSALMRATPIAMTAIQRGQYGRIDSLHSPESDKVGSVQEMTAMAKLDPATGEILAPYERVIDGVPTGQVEYVSATKELNKYIVGWDNDLTEQVVMARYNGDVTTVARHRVSYRDVSPFCDMSVSRMTIPFPEFSQPRRSLMATKMSSQAVPLIFPERPRVSTGADTEIPCLYYTARQVVESALGAETVTANPEQKMVILSVKWTKSSATYSCVFCGNVFNFAVPFTGTDKETLYSYNLNYKDDNIYGLDDIVFYNQSCDIGQHDYWERVKQGTLPLIKNIGAPAMALGTNLLVMFKTYASSTVDDAVVISDRLVRNRKLSSIQIFKYSYELKPGESFKQVGATAPLHSHVYDGQPLITAVRGKADQVREKQVYAEQAGEVVVSEIQNTERGQVAEVWVATIHDAAIGDKVAGRYGNKSVIAKIIPEHDMPYDPETGMNADIICSPLGLPSRMNYGQVIEATLGIAMAQEGKYAVVTPFYPGIKGEVENEYKAAGLEMKRLYNPVYGKYTERPVMLGVMYFLKLEQMSNLKWSAVGYPTAVDPVFGQPISSTNTYKGQSMEEMITWALAAAGSKTILGNFFSLYSTDEASRKRYFEMLDSNYDDGPGTWDENTAECVQYEPDNKDALVTQVIMRMFGIDLVVKGESAYQYVPLKLDDITVDLSIDAFKSKHEIVSETEWCKISLKSKVVNPFWVENFPLNIVLGVKSVKTLVNKSYYLNVYERTLISAKEVENYQIAALVTGIEAVIALLENTTIDQAIARLVSTTTSNETVGSDVLDSIEGSGGPITGTVVEDNNEIGIDIDVPVEVADVVRFLRMMQSEGLELSDLVWNYMPIMPRIFRQSTVINGVESEHSFTKQLRYICECGTSSDAYEAFRRFIGYGDVKADDLASIRGYFFGKGSQSGQHGTVRGNVLSKRIGFSGRAVIVPSMDIRMSPYFIGIPWRQAMIELSKVLAIRLHKRATRLAHELLHEHSVSLLDVLPNISTTNWEKIVATLGEYNDFVFKKYFGKLDYEDRVFLFNFLRSEVKFICEGNVSEDGLVKVNGEWCKPEELPLDATIDAAVVEIGRQPTLHKKSTRCFFMKLVDGYSQSIHPMVCEGFNADFDGDTMWNAQLFGEMKVEGWKTISVLQDLISEKDGSYTLGLVQDTALGLYCATIFKDNTKTFSGKRGAYYYFDSADALRMQLEYGDLHYYDAVVFNNSGRLYISTAGRVLLNAIVPGALTSVPFDDKWGICEAVLGPEAISSFCQMKYDTVWLATSIRPEGRPSGIKIEKVLLDIYGEYGARKSVDCAQKFYEIGLTASDIYSVTVSTSDMSVGVDTKKFMDEPQQKVAQLNTLEQMGLISEKERKLASARAWDKARKSAMDEVVRAIPENSNTHFLMYSGARGKPDQVMQTVGFIGIISKTTTSDIEYPILSSYGSGLSSLDLAQTCYTARIGVVSTQTGTKDTGYATRQTVYMSSGMEITEDDCGIEWRFAEVKYTEDGASVVDINGNSSDLYSLVGEFVDPSSETLSVVMSELNKSGYILTEDILNLAVKRGVEKIALFDRVYSLHSVVDPSWRDHAVNELYSYALPFTDGLKVTDKSMDWIESHGLRNVILFSEEDAKSGNCFDKEAYLPVDYDTSKYDVKFNGSDVSEEVLYGRKVSEDSENYFVYSGLLDDSNALTVKALRYLTKKKIRKIAFSDGSVATFKYKLAPLFTELVLGRDSIGLPFLDKDGCITEKTLDEVEHVQLDYLPVRTMLTCLSNTGVCKHCRGKSPSTRMYSEIGDNIGISAAQAQCEPLSQATLNVQHSGGKRGAGTGLVSGLDYYKKMLHGKTATKNEAALLEGFAGHSGYVRKNSHNNRISQIVNEDGETLETIYLDDPERLNVPDGAYVFKGDTIRVGLPVLERYCTRDIFWSALKTRYLLMQEYYKIFKALNVSPRNYEILAREQTSICYLDEPRPLPFKKDTGDEARNPTGAYILKVSPQSEVVNKYSGIAGFAFESVASMLLSGVTDSDGLSLNSVLGNFVTGTTVGSKKAKFIPRRFGAVNSKHTKSAVRELSDAVKSYKVPFDSGAKALHSEGSQSIGDVMSMTDSLLATLLKVNGEIGDGTTDMPAIESISVDSSEVEDEISNETVECQESSVIVEDAGDVTEVYEGSARIIDDSPVTVSDSEQKENSKHNKSKVGDINRLTLE